MKAVWLIAAGTVGFALAAGHPAAAASENCRAIQDPAKRLACYDAREDQKHEDKVAHQKADFGLSEKQKAPEDRNEVAEVSGKIVRVAGSRIYLADGAVWTFAHDSRLIDWIRPGQQVTIKRGLVGGYRATVSGVNGREAVTRTQ
jgi:hypothetical protein